MSSVGMLLDDPASFGTLLVIGALVYNLVRHGFIAVVDRARGHLPWIALWASGIVFAIARLVHETTADPELGLHMVRVQFGAAILLPGLGLASIESAWGLRPTPMSTRIVAGTIPIVVACTWTDWLVSGPPIRRVDVFGRVFYEGHAWGMIAVAVVACVVGAIAARRRTRVIPREVESMRPVIRIAVLAFVIAAINDALVGAGVLPTPRVLEYGYVVFGLVTTAFERRRLAFVNATHVESIEGKHAELVIEHAALEASRRRYRQLADASREGVVLCDGTTIRDANRAACELFGDDLERLRETRLDELVDTAHRASARTLIETAGEGEIEIRRRDGTRVPASMKVIPRLPSSGDELVVLLRDVSVERQLQTRLQRADRLASLGALAAGTAHEINNPLAFVLTNAEFAREQVAGLRDQLSATVAGDLTDLLETIVTGSQRIRNIVRELSLLARERPVDDVLVDVGKTLTACLAMAATQIKHRAKVVTELEDVPPVRANESRLFQAFLNLIVNAAHAIEPGHVSENHIRVSARARGGMVEVTVEDTGSGVPDEHKEKLFDAFFTTKEVGHGTGLGLSICHSIVTSLGGTIDFTTAVGVGTTFHIALPAAEVPVASEPMPATASEPAGPRRRVLVVDDEQLVARSFARALRMHDVEIARSGREALERLERERYDVVLCDVMMPDLTGQEVFQALRGRRDAAIERIVFMTGGTCSEHMRVFLEEEAPRWFLKPIAPAALREIVAEVVTVTSDDRADILRA